MLVRGLVAFFKTKLVVEEVFFLVGADERLALRSLFTGLTDFTLGEGTTTLVGFVLFTLEVEELFKELDTAELGRTFLDFRTLSVCVILLDLMTFVLLTEESFGEFLSLV